MKGERGGLSLLQVGTRGFVFSFVGAVLALGVSRLFISGADHWIVLSAIGALFVSVWGWLYWQHSESGHETNMSGENLKEGPLS